jgi:tetratricopeptide (TPR) repeat protein
MLEAPTFEQTLKRIRLKFEEGQEEEALALLDAISTADPQEQKDILFTRAWFYTRKEQWDQAVSLLAPLYKSEHFEAEWQDVNLTERGRRATYLLWFGNTAVNHSYYEDAANYYTQCLKILDMRRVHLPKVQIQALLGYATTCIELGLYASATQQYQEALRLSMKEKIADYLPYIYHGLAEAQRWVGSFDKAYENGNTALRMFREADNRYYECRILNLLGRIAYKEGNHRMASDHYMESLTIATIDNFSGMKLINIVSMAELLLDEGRLEEARRYSDHGLEVCDEVKDDHQLQGMMYLTRGKIEQAEAAKAQSQQARYLYEEALSYYGKAKTHIDQTQARMTYSELLSHIAEVYEAMQEPDVALDYWKSALQIANQAKAQS